MHMCFAKKKKGMNLVILQIQCLFFNEVANICLNFNLFYPNTIYDFVAKKHSLTSCLIWRGQHLILVVTVKNDLGLRSK